jgi:hypothetical protein
MHINFKDVTRRGTALFGAVGLLAALGLSAVTSGVASADSLNPLTDRSLTLSSSSPGWAYTDGSGNSTYAPPNSGANGQKTGNYFGFRVSTDSQSTADGGTGSPIKAMSFQYCTKSAGNCSAPGDNAGDPTASDNDSVSGQTSDLNIQYPSASEIDGTATAGAGTISLTSGSATVTGSGTSFTSLAPGSVFETAGGNYYVIQSIASATSLTITSNAVATESAVTYTTNGATKGAGTISLTSGSAAVTGSGTTFTNMVVGGTFETAGGNYYTIQSINSNTSLTITTNAVATESAVGYSTSDFMQVVNPSTGLVTAVPGYTDENPKYQAGGGTGDPAEAAKSVAGNFVVMFNNGSTWVESPGWTATTSNQEETTATGKQNTIILQNSDGLGLPSAAQVKVLFFATSSNYITNPGAGYFFVKINTFSTFPALGGGNTLADNVAAPGDVIDGGVTVANVMNQSIQITTRVLETMQFSVGTVDPDTLTNAQLDASSNGTSTHEPCDTILTGMTPSDSQDVLQLGDQTEESSLSTTTTYATHSYWRLSSNSSAGATVYYSGHTLSDTSGDEITPIGNTATASAPGAEQFGLALDTTGVDGTTGVANLTTAPTELVLMKMLPITLRQALSRLILTTLIIQVAQPQVMVSILQC